MRIGLLTYHHSVSYGATLQTYATCKALQQLGHEVEIIDFRLEDKHSLLYRLVFCLKDYDTRHLWQRVYPKLSSYYPDQTSLQQASLDYDCLMVGSDQTWNPNISGERFLMYFLDFGSDQVRRVSYASSFGVSKWPESYLYAIPEIRRLLGRFHAISTRESAGQRILKQTFGFDATLVVDPTMLIRDYSDLSGEVPPTSMLNSFIMNRTAQQLQRVRELGKVIGKRPVMTSTIRPYSGFTYCYPPSIGKWLRYIGGADFVVVDSFHALVFCLKYQRQFVVITPDNGKNSRLTNLLHLVGLENRFFYDNDQTIPYEQLYCDKIDYTGINRILEAEKEKSLDYLRRSLA